MRAADAARAPPPSRHPWPPAQVPFILAQWEEYHTGGRAGVGAWLAGRRAHGASPLARVFNRQAAGLLLAPTHLPPAPPCPPPAPAPGVMTYGNGVIGITEILYSVVALHFATGLLG